MGPVQAMENESKAGLEPLHYFKDLFEENIASRDFLIGHNFVGVFLQGDHGRKSLPAVIGALSQLYIRSTIQRLVEKLLDNVEDGHLFLCFHPKLVSLLGRHIRLPNHVQAFGESRLGVDKLFELEQGMTFSVVDLNDSRISLNCS